MQNYIVLKICSKIAYKIQQYIKTITKKLKENIKQVVHINFIKNLYINDGWTFVVKEINL